MQTWPSIDAALSDADIVGIAARWQCVQDLAGFPSSLAEPAAARHASDSAAAETTAAGHRTAFSTGEPSPNAESPSSSPSSFSPSPTTVTKQSTVAQLARPSSAPAVPTASHQRKRRVSFCMNAGPHRGVVQSAALVPCCAATVLHVAATNPSPKPKPSPTLWPALTLLPSPSPHPHPHPHPHPKPNQVLSVAANKLRLKRREAGRARCFVWHTGAEVRHDATTNTTTTTRLLLLLGSRVLLHAYDYTSTTTRVHNSTTPLLHYYTTTLLHYSTTALLHHTTTPPHYHTTAHP